MPEEYEKTTSDGTHTIESEQVLICAETGRVIAVFYNDYDLDDVLKKVKENKKLPGVNTMRKLIKILMTELKEQHKYSAELEECSGPEVDESFDGVKSSIIEKLQSSGFKDFAALDQISKS